MVAALLLLSVFFAVVLASARATICAICMATTATWITLLLLRLFGAEVSSIVLAILMGASATGSMYYLSGHIPQFAFWKFPYIVAAFASVYMLARWAIDWTAVFAVAGIILLWGLLFLLRSTKLQRWVRAIISCCRDW